jgi:hypothetical protein
VKHQVVFGLGLLVFAFGLGLLVGDVALSWVVFTVGGVVSTGAAIVSIFSLRKTPRPKPETVPFVVGGREVTRLRVVDTTIRDEARQ